MNYENCPILPESSKCSSDNADECCGGGFSLAVGKSVRCQCRKCHPEVPAPVEAVFETTLRFYATGVDEETVVDLKAWVYSYLSAQLKAIELEGSKTGRTIETDFYTHLIQVQE